MQTLCTENNYLNLIILSNKIGENEKLLKYASDVSTFHRKM